MTRGDFRELVVSMVRYSGAPYIEDVADQNVLISERVRAFTVHTLCLYNPVVPFTMLANTASYSLRDTQSFDLEMVRVQKVVVNGQPLYNFQGVQGPTSLDELSYRFPTYLTDSTATPQYFAPYPPHHIRLYPKPDANGQANTTSVAGWYMHPTLTGSGVSDSTELSLPEEWVRTAAMFTAGSLLIPTADGDVDAQRLQVLMGNAQAEMQEIKERSLQMLEGPTVRGVKRSGPIYHIG